MGADNTRRYFFCPVGIYGSLLLHEGQLAYAASSFTVILSLVPSATCLCDLLLRLFFGFFSMIGDPNSFCPPRQVILLGLHTVILRVSSCSWLFGCVSEFLAY